MNRAFAALRDRVRQEAFWFSVCFNTPKFYALVRRALPRKGDAP